MIHKGVYILIGPPGTGKTRFLADRTQRIVEQHTGFGGITPKQSPVLICSLTRTAAAEIAARTELPQEAVATIHAHAYRSIGCPPIIDKDDIKDWNKKHPEFKIPSESIDEELGGRVDELNGSCEFNEYHLYRNKMTPRDIWPGQIQYFAKYWERFKKERDKIDYTDMLEQAADHPPFKPKVIIVDEAQDTSRLAFNVLLKWQHHCQAMIVVGDPWQSLYTWAGADPTILTDTTIDATHRGVLKQSYRVPKAVHEYAVQWVRKLSDYKPIEYLPRRKDHTDPESPVAKGIVTTCHATWRYPALAAELANKETLEGRSVMLVFSCNYMTAPVVAYMRRHGMPFSNPWRTRNGFWNPLTPREGVTSIVDRVEALCRPWMEQPQRLWTTWELYLWTQYLKKGILNHGAKADIKRAAQINPDRVVSPDEVIKWFSTRDWLYDLSDYEEWNRDQIHKCVSWFESVIHEKCKEAVDFIKSATLSGARGTNFSNSNFFPYIREPRIYVGTIHSFKGGEADTVVVFPDLSFTAYQAWICPGTEGRDAIVRAYYVAFTRARRKLVLCGREGKNAVMFPPTVSAI